MTANSTSFKPGNQAAKGNNGGRPKEVDPLTEAAALLEWCKKDDVYIIRIFGPLRGYTTSTMYKMVEDSPVFSDAWDIATTIIGARREQKLVDSGNARPFDRYADWYDQRLKEHEQLKQKYEAKLKEEEAQKDPELVEQFKQFMKFMSEAQSSHRSQDAKNISKEEKS